MATTTISDVTVLLSAKERTASFAADVRAGLSGSHLSLPSKWLYDERGSALFDAITELEEYYPTRAERAVLDTHADAIAARCGAETLIELGSGTSTKTRLLIEALHRHGTLRRFVAFDVAEPTLREAVATLATDYPGLGVTGVVGDFEQHLDHLPAGAKRMVAFLGGTIGNLDRAARARFFGVLASRLTPGEGLLLGADLIKDTARLVAAYDDRERVTEAFEKNALSVVNRAFGANFDLDRFAYRARWSETEERIEMGLVARGNQEVVIPDLDLVLELDDGEEIHTEISTKFRVEGLAGELGAAGLELSDHWTDPAGDFALLLARRTDGEGPGVAQAQD